jgi:hypothetical protein
MGEPSGELDLAEEAVGTEDGGQLGTEDLETDGTMVFEVGGQIDRGHAAAAEFPLDPVAVRESGGQALEVRAHRPRASCSSFARASATIHAYSGSGLVKASRNAT